MKKVLAVLLSAMMLFTCVACGGAKKEESKPVEEKPSEPVKVMVLNGTTGFGMANMMDQKGYQFSVETDPSNIVAALANGSVDIAALPTNAASAVYNKTEGKVQVLALNTLGVLYLVSDGSEAVTSMADLEGKTVYAPAQNPSFIFNYLCQKNGLSNVTVDNTYAQPADLNTAVASGEVALAVLPEPMLTVAKAKNPNLQVVMDLTEEWDKVSQEGSLVQGCVVVRKEFAEKNEEAVKAFLASYEKSINTLKTDVEGTAAKIQEYGIFAKKEVAAKAIPNCNVCFIQGEEMKEAMSEFLNIMGEVAPKSIGGKVPGEDFYCIVK